MTQKTHTETHTQTCTQTLTQTLTQADTQNGQASFYIFALNEVKNQCRHETGVL